MTKYLLDTSAILALRENESGADEVESILRLAKNRKAFVYLSFMTFMEIYYLTWRHAGKGMAYRTFLELKMLPIERVNLEEEILLLSGELKATYPLSVADSWIAATALYKEATLIHKDPEFEALKERLPVRFLS